LNRYRQEINEQISDWGPTVTTDGIELDVEKVLKHMAQENDWKSKKEVSVCFGIDARLLSKGLKGTKP
jgi:hypothetical protein